MVATWSTLLPRLRFLCRLYLATCVVFFVGTLLPSRVLAWLVYQILGITVLLVLLVSYVIAYRVQAGLHRAKLSRQGPWVVFVAPFVIAPLFQSFGDTYGEWLLFLTLAAIAPFGVLTNANRISKRHGSGTPTPPPETPSPA